MAEQGDQNLPATEEEPLLGGPGILLTHAPDS